MVCAVEDANSFVQEDNTEKKYMDEDELFIIKQGYENMLVKEVQERPYHQFPKEMKIGDFIGISDYLSAGEPLDHYQSVIIELINERKDTNAVSLWSDAKSITDNGRVWGGFLSARSDLKEGEDSQLIGLEIDVLNGGLRGEYPNHSKVGLQIVGFGNLNTNAIEVLSDNEGLWQNIINVQNGTVERNGTVIGVAQKSPINIGIDFSNTPFDRAAMLVSNNSKLSFISKQGNDASIYTDDIGNGYLAIQTGKEGIRFINNENSANILTIKADGTIDPDCLFYKNNAIDNINFGQQTYSWIISLISFMVIAILAIIIIYMVSQMNKLNKKIIKLSNIMQIEDNAT